jgi:hypothetical protein
MIGRGSFTTMSVAAALGLAACGGGESEIADGDVRAFTRLRTSLDGLGHRIDKLSLRYGFKECADD